jgi:hypothetical protein
MTAAELLTVVLAVLALGLAAAAALVCARALRAARELTAATEAFRAEAAPALEELRAAVVRATAEVDRVEDLLDVASTIGARLDGASEVTYRALTSPVIKGVALASGTRRAAERLREPAPRRPAGRRRGGS